jgi:excisionase family DNA binding protein
MGKRFLSPGPGFEWPGPLLTVSEAAKFLGVGRKQVYRLIEEGEIEAVKLGRSIQVPQNSLDRFRASGKLT